jgi:hypothetical protein
MSPRAQNAILCLAACAIAVGFIVMTADINYPSNVFPYLVSICILFFATIVFFTRVLSVAKAYKQEPDHNGRAKFHLLRTLLISVVSSLYVIFIPIGGFYFTSTIFLIMLFLIAHPKSLSLGLIFKASGVTIIVLLIVFFVFNYFLNVPTPKGLFM